ncbi:MAG: hypothetical protein L6Q53_01210 [Candidatus Brocadia sinica]|nr:hypothetical protein [Candidatus Brocadia sinica]NUO04504.1 hypothetical protein [Candidatus Brocadia sinica]
MAVIAGIDEAGYGPTLGPMVSTVVAFDVPDEMADCSLWELLKEAVSNERRARKRRLAVLDSKKLYNAHNGLKPLEDAVLSFLWSKGLKIASFFQLLGSLSCYNTNAIARYPWYKDKDYPLPLTTSISVIVNYADLLQYVFRKHNVRFSYARSCVVTVQEFNEQVRSFGNKSVVLFNNCAALISSLWNLCDGNIRLIVDKQGGRNTYTSLLKAQLPMADLEVLNESARVSTYEVVDTGKRMKISFVEKGEDICMAAALASIFSKYVRELFMRLENQYWIQLLPGLKPTAGYYSDAQRFLSQIRDVREKKAIQDDILIRIK